MADPIVVSEVPEPQVQSEFLGLQTINHNLVQYIKLLHGRYAREDRYTRDTHNALERIGKAVENTHHDDTPLRYDLAQMREQFSAFTVVVAAGFVLLGVAQFLSRRRP